MQVLRCSPEHPDCSPHGAYRLVPDAGWELLQTFIDFSSGLLIVSTNCTDRSLWTDDGFGARTIPTRTYVVDAASGMLLSPEAWRAHFDYRPHRRRSEDGTLELVSRRVPAERRNDDDIEEELFEVASGKLVGRSSSIGFHHAPHEDLLDAHLRKQREAAERQRALDAKLSPEVHAARVQAALEAGQLVIAYCGEDRRWELRVVDLGFELLVGPSTKNVLERVRTFACVEDFWAFLNPDGRAYLRYRVAREPAPASGALAACVLASSNALRCGLAFTHDEFWRAHEWDAATWSDDIHPAHRHQACPHCGALVRYSPRYPTYICPACCEREIVDAQGRKVTFSNVGISGGLRISYWQDGQIRHDDCSQIECACFIDGKPYIATEARFGGVVILAPFA